MDESIPNPASARQARLVWVIRLGGFLALLTVGYLLWTAGFQHKPMGCGAASDCNYVLRSRWAYWLSLPTSLPALAAYLTLLAATLYASPLARPRQQRVAWTVLLFLAVAIAASAVWFVSLQVWVLHSVCLYCMTAHLLGLLTAGLIVRGLLLGRLDGPAVGRVAAILAVALGLLAAGGLIAGQVLFPHTSVIRTEAGEVKLDFRRLPVLGSPDAPYQITVLTDFTCPYCRLLHQMLGNVRQRYGRQLAIAVLPVPLSSDCNPAIESTARRHRDACELAKLALAVWLADAKSYEAMERILFEPSWPPTVEAARQQAEHLVGQPALEQALADPRLRQMLERNVKLYAELDGESLPKLIVGHNLFEGIVGDERVLYHVLERELGVSPIANPPPLPPTATQISQPSTGPVDDP